MFLSSISYESVSGQKPIATITYYLQVIKESGINYGLGRNINKGHYLCKLVFDRSINKGDLIEEKCNLTSISGKEYADSKKLNAAMLSMETSTIPKYLNW